MILVGIRITTRTQPPSRSGSTTVSTVASSLIKSASRFRSERVVAAASTLGWRRNLLVSGMQTGKTRTVGVVIPPYDSFWIGVLAGIHERLGQADFRLHRRRGFLSAPFCLARCWCISGGFSHVPPLRC